MKGLLLLRNSVSYCVKEERPCVGWINKYFKDCLCNTRDEFSFALGLASLVCWGVAEIPQIVTNFRTKSSHGISLVFLLTWVAGDMFNLVGCLLEPATLPTQFYTALLYTTTTVLLVLQSLYYDYFYRWWKARKHDSFADQIEDVKKPLRPHKHKVTDHSGIPIPNPTSKQQRRESKDYYYTSARSLAGSATPPIRSSPWPIRSGPSAIGVEDGSSSDEDERFPNASPTRTSGGQPKPISRSVGYGALLATSMSMPQQTKAMMQAYMGFGGRKLLHEHGMGNSMVYGQWLGWMMTAIYMSGRIPQIWLNIKRGSVEGLNPMMFILAVTANITYVGSILVRSSEWDKIKANLPWLLDAVACVLLDLFIISQYVYYKYLAGKMTGDEEDCGGSYVDESK